MSYSLDINRPTPYVVVDHFDAIGEEGVYAGTYEDCEAFIAEQGDSPIIGMYEIVLNWRHNN